MQHIEVFADIVCPFTHVGLRRLREVRPEENADEVPRCAPGRSNG